MKLPRSELGDIQAQAKNQRIENRLQADLSAYRRNTQST